MFALPGHCNRGRTGIVIVLTDGFSLAQGWYWLPSSPVLSCQLPWRHLRASRWQTSCRSFSARRHGIVEFEPRSCLHGSSNCQWFSGRHCLTPFRDACTSRGHASTRSRTPSTDTWSWLLGASGTTRRWTGPSPPPARQSNPCRHSGGSLPSRSRICPTEWASLGQTATRPSSILMQSGPCVLSSCCRTVQKHLVVPIACEAQAELGGHPVMSSPGRFDRYDGSHGSTVEQ